MEESFRKYEEARLFDCGPRIHAAVGAVIMFAGQVDRERAAQQDDRPVTNSLQHLLRDLLWGAWVLGYEHHCDEAAAEASSAPSSKDADHG